MNFRISCHLRTFASRCWGQIVRPSTYQTCTLPLTYSSSPLCQSSKGSWFLLACTYKTKPVRLIMKDSISEKWHPILNQFLVGDSRRKKKKRAIVGQRWCSAFGPKIISCQALGVEWQLNSPPKNRHRTSLKYTKFKNTGIFELKDNQMLEKHCCFNYPQRNKRQ